MIRYTLSCPHEHAFEAWFAGSEAYEKQKKAGLIPCPVCGSTDVDKTLMTPSVSTSRSRSAEQADAPVPVAANPPVSPEALAALRQIRDQVTKNADYVGADFPEEARKIHYGEREKTGIYGEAGLEDIKNLHEEGIEVMPLPVLPEDKN
jgi:hypothetical protein